MKAVYPNRIDLLESLPSPVPAKKESSDMDLSFSFEPNSGIARRKLHRRARTCAQLSQPLVLGPEHVKRSGNGNFLSKVPLLRYLMRSKRNIMEAEVEKKVSLQSSTSRPLLKVDATTSKRALWARFFLLARSLVNVRRLVSKSNKKKMAIPQETLNSSSTLSIYSDSSDSLYGGLDSSRHSLYSRASSRKSLEKRYNTSPVTLRYYDEKNRALYPTDQIYEEVCRRNEIMMKLRDQNNTTKCEYEPEDAEECNKDMIKSITHYGDAAKTKWPGLEEEPL